MTLSVATSTPLKGKAFRALCVPGREGIHPAHKSCAPSAKKPETPDGGQRYGILLRLPFLVTSHSPLVTEILIANLELEFRLTHRKISPLRISNRKFFAI